MTGLLIAAGGCALFYPAANSGYGVFLFAFFVLAAGITIDALPGEPARRPYEIAMKCLKKGFYVRYGGDTIQLAPPFIIEKSEIDSLINALGEALNETA